MAEKLNEILIQYREFAKYLNSINLDQLVGEHSLEELKNFHEELRRKEIRQLNEELFKKIIELNNKSSWDINRRNKQNEVVA